ncbi:MAG: hypothetical protein A2X31_07850 [Elusimicrobia bacterium GWB2_63_22]|nr:MAG: hypothetical protein A2X31_07850 [Elusimicrobia bacterium GWB2_63_22]
MTAFALALKDPAAPPEAAAGFLVNAGAADKDAAREFVRRNPGFLGRALTREAAEKLRAAAAAAGLATALFDEEEVKLPPLPLRAARLEPKGTGFEVQAGGAIVFMKYEDVRLIAAAAYDAPLPPPSQEALKASIFDGIRRLAGLPGYEPALSEPPKDTFFRADIVMADNTRLLLEPEALDFSALGPSRSHSSLVNFRALLDALSAPAFKAARNAFLLAFLASKPITGMKTAGPDACDTALSLLLLLIEKREG